jgi:hypothetical protein
MQSSGLYTSGFFSCMSGFWYRDAVYRGEVAWGFKFFLKLPTSNNNRFDFFGGMKNFPQTMTKSFILYLI